MLVKINGLAGFKKCFEILRCIFLNLSFKGPEKRQFAITPDFIYSR